MRNVCDYIDDLLPVLENFRGKSSAIMAVEVAKPLGTLIIELNTHNQLFQSGKDGTGKPIVPKYAAATIKYKRQKGQPVNRVTLRDSGDFHRSFNVRFIDDQIIISANDPKTLALVEKYGEDILGLDDSSLSTLKDKARPLLIDELRKLIGNVQ